MSSDPSSIEFDLRLLRAAALDESLLTRLDACSAESWTELDPSEIHFERQLAGIAPAALSTALMAALESTVSGARFPVEEKIVIFPQREALPARHHRGWWSAAAAVALTGAVTAFFVPMERGHQKLTAISQGTEQARPAPRTGGLIPAGFNRGLSEASDEGVIWQSNNQPHRVLKVVYKERATLKDADGRTYQVEQPRVEYILVPTKTD